MRRTAVLLALPLVILGCTVPLHRDAAVRPLCLGGLIPVGGTGLCTHGPDPVVASSSPYRCFGGIFSDPLICSLDHQPNPNSRKAAGDCGTTGYRVAPVYLVAPGAADQYQQSLGLMTNALMSADDILDANASTEGGHAHLRILSDVNCNISVADVRADRPLTSFDAVVAALQDAGMGSEGDRIWLAFTDGATLGNYCGQASIVADSNPDPAVNLNNAAGTGHYAYVQCWTQGSAAGEITLHELSHNMGAVQLDAPHSTGAWHCTDGADVMCYNDGGPHASQQSPAPCPGNVRFDCGQDDYFSLTPQGGYLPGHWNLRNSYFLTVTG